MDLQESKDKSRFIFDNATVGIAISDASGKLYDINKAGSRIIGYTLAEFSKKKLSDIYVSPKDREKFIEILKQDGFVENFEVQLKRENGQIYWVSLSSKPIIWEGKDAILNFLLDITKRKKAEQLLKDERNKAQTYLDIAGVIFIAINAKGEVTLANQKGCDILGYTQEEIIGKNWFENFVPVSIRNDVKTVFSKIIRGDVELIDYYVNPVVTRLGEERIISWHNTSLNDSDGNIIGTLSSGEDITEHIEAEDKLKISEQRYRYLSEELAESNSMKEILLDVISHDLKNPVGTIIDLPPKSCTNV
jgi:PAS domain S-box-containing protein